MQVPYALDPTASPQAATTNVSGRSDGVVREEAGAVPETRDPYITRSIL